MEYYDIKLERTLLRIMLTDSSITKSLMESPEFGEAIFSENNNRTIYKSIIYYFKLHGDNPQADSLFIISRKLLPVSKLYNKHQQAEKIKLLINKLFDVPANKKEINSVSDIIEELTILKKGRTIQNSIIEAAEQLEKGEINLAEKALVEYKLDFLAESDLVDEGDYVEDWIERARLIKLKQRHPELFDAIPSGIVGYNPFNPYEEEKINLDMFIDGGFYNGELHLIVGDSGAGKSFELMEFAYRAAYIGKEVGFFTIEMSKWKQATRLDSRITGIPYRDFKIATHFNKEQYKKWKQKMEEFSKKGRIHIVGFPKGCTVVSIEAKAKEIEQRIGKSLDIIIVDYLNDIKPTGSYNTEKDWGAQGQISWALKQLAGSWNRNKGIPVITANQGKSSSLLGKLKLNSKGMVDFKKIIWNDVAFSPLPPQHASIIIGLLYSTVNDNKTADMINHQIVKNRDNGTSPGVVTFPNFSICRINSEIQHKKAIRTWEKRKQIIDGEEKVEEI